MLGGEAVTLGGAHFLDAGLPPPAVRVARHGDLATAVGGAAFALHALLRPYGHDNGALRIRTA